MVRRQTSIRILFKTALLWGAVAALGASVFGLRLGTGEARQSIVFSEPAPAADLLHQASYPSEVYPD